MNCIDKDDKAITASEQVEIAETLEETLEYLSGSKREDDFQD